MVHMHACISYRCAAWHGSSLALTGTEVHEGLISSSRILRGPLVPFVEMNPVETIVRMNRGVDTCCNAGDRYHVTITDSRFLNSVLYLCSESSRCQSVDSLLVPRYFFPDALSGHVESML